MCIPRLTGTAVLAAIACLLVPVQAQAQPQQPDAGEVSAPLAVAPSPPAASVPDGDAPDAVLPLVPDLPALPRGATPPAAVVGVLSVPDAMGGSSAAQHAQQVLSERRRRFDEDARREQAALQALQQELASQRARLPPAQFEAKVRSLRQRAAGDQRRFAERGRVLQETGQYLEGQIQQVLIAVVRQVSESRGVNLVLQRGSVMHGLLALDLTVQVTEQLNKALPDVAIPPEGEPPPLVARAQPTVAAPPAAPPPSRPVRATPPHR